MVYLNIALFTSIFVLVSSQSDILNYFATDPSLFENRTDRNELANVNRGGENQDDNTVKKLVSSKA